MPRHYLLDDEQPVVYDTNSISFTVAGSPIACARACVGATNGAETWWHDPQKRMREEFRDVLDGIIEGVGVGRPHFEDGEVLDMTVVFQVQSTVRGPDVDNMIKFVMHACEGYLYSDENMVFRVEGTKVLAPHTETTGSTHIMVRIL